MKHNHWAIVFAVFFQQSFAFFWYSKHGFFDAWKIALGEKFTPANPGASVMLVSFIGSLMFYYLMSWLYQVLVIDDWWRGFVVGALIGMGFLMPNLSTHYVFIVFPPDLIWIDGFSYVFSPAIPGVILAIWRADRTIETAT